MSLTSYQAAPPCNNGKGRPWARPGLCQRPFWKKAHFALATRRGDLCVRPLCSFNPSTITIDTIARRPIWPTCVSKNIDHMNVTAKDLLDAGVHFGHQTKRWNPRSKPFIFDHRQGITIIDLGKTHEALTKACAFVEETVANGGNVLFVGTKRQAKEIVREAATALTMPM